MNLEFAALQENIAACIARKEATEALIGMVDERLEPKWFMRTVKMTRAEVAALMAPRDEFDISDYIAEERFRSLTRVATDGERADGRLCWVPGALPHDENPVVI